VSRPGMILSESAAAAAFGLINGTGHLGGFFGPYIISFLSERTHSFAPGFAFIGICYIAAAFLIIRLRIASTSSIDLESAAVPGGIV
jgi:ACS family tartrate transporter-like MFS transporter